MTDCDLIFKITAEDGLFVQSKDINDAWKKVTKRVNKLRKMNNFKLLSHQGIIFFSIPLSILMIKIN